MRKKKKKNPNVKSERYHHASWSLQQLSLPISSSAHTAGAQSERIIIPLVAARASTASSTTDGNGLWTVPFLIMRQLPGITGFNPSVTEED